MQLASKNKKKTKKANRRLNSLRGPAIRSDDEDSEECHDDVTSDCTKLAPKRGASPKTKKRKRKGMGYGGAPPSSSAGNDDDEASETVSPRVSAYGKEAMVKLKLEQRYKPIDAGETGHESLSADENKLKTKAVFEEVAKSSPSLPSYLPLPGGKKLTNREGPESGAQHSEEPTVLTGEEAFRLQEGCGNPNDNHEGAPSLTSVVEETNLYANPEVEESSSAWEAQVSRRAGVSTKNVSNDGVRQHQGPAHQAGGSLASSSQLRNKFSSTLGQLEHQQEDLQRAVKRREAEIEQTRTELERQEKDLDRSGKALEYYQHLRERLIGWVGALRELSGRVMPIQEALHELEAEVAAGGRWKDWENDMISVLHEHSFLDQILGRQPPPAIYDKMMTVDEFGRDVKSQHVMHREKRARHRKNIQEQRRRPPREDESDAFLSDEEQESFRERHVALQQALVVALNELDEHYTALRNLVDLFSEWQKAYGEDYMQCFATLSLADLTSVMVQVELCSLNDPWNESGGYNEARWTTGVHSALEEGILDKAGVERIVEKGILPAVSDILKREGYNLVSSRQARSLGAFIKHVQKILPADSAILTTLHDSLVSYMKQQLSNIAIPIVRKTSVPADDTPEELSEAIEGATMGQVNRVKKVVLNLLTCWAEVLGDDEDLISLILDFISNKLLFLLSSLKGVEKPDSGTAVQVFHAVWNSLQPLGWLGRPEWIVQSAPIRAAAAAYQIPALNEQLA